MTIRELTERLQWANPDARVVLLDVSGRGLRQAITNGEWAIQVEDEVVYVRIDDAPREKKA